MSFNTCTECDILITSQLNVKVITIKTVTARREKIYIQRLENHVLLPSLRIVGLIVTN